MALSIYRKHWLNSQSIQLLTVCQPQQGDLAKYLKSCGLLFQIFIKKINGRMEFSTKYPPMPTQFPEQISQHTVPLAALHTAGLGPPQRGVTEPLFLRFYGVVYSSLQAL